MEQLLEAVWDTSSVSGRLVTSVVLIVLAVVLAGVAGRLTTLRVADTSNRYRYAGQCSALQGGGEGPRWEGRQARAVP